jgi:hypothetical protein
MVELLAMTLGGESRLRRNIPQNTKLGEKAKCDYDPATGRSGCKRARSSFCWQILDRCVLNQDGGVPSHQ